MKLIGSFRKDLLYAFLLSFTLLILFDVVFRESEELFPGGLILVDFIVKLAYSIFAATAFYFVAVHKKDSDARDRVSPAINDNINELVSFKNTLLSELYFIAVTRNNGEVDWPKNGGANIERYYPTEHEIFVLLQNVPLCETRHAIDNWISRLDLFLKEIKPSCETLLLFSAFLKAEEIKVIAAIRGHKIRTKISFYSSNTRIANPNMSFLNEEIKSLLQLFEELESLDWSK